MDLEVSLLAGRNIAAMRTMPSPECFHHHNIGKSILNIKIYYIKS